MTIDRNFVNTMCRLAAKPWSSTPLVQLVSCASQIKLPTPLELPITSFSLRSESLRKCDLSLVAVREVELGESTTFMLSGVWTRKKRTQGTRSAVIGRLGARPTWTPSSAASRLPADGVSLAGPIAGVPGGSGSAVPIGIASGTRHAAVSRRLPNPFHRRRYALFRAVRLRLGPGSVETWKGELPSTRACGSVAPRKRPTR